MYCLSYFNSFSVIVNMFISFVNVRFLLKRLNYFTVRSRALHDTVSNNTQIYIVIV